jgi:hypothetical protein
LWHKADIQLSLSNVRFWGVKRTSLERTRWLLAGEAEWGLLWVRIPLWESNCRLEKMRQTLHSEELSSTSKHLADL